MTTSHTHRPSDQKAEHTCSPELCTYGLREVAHREVPEQFTPRREGDPHTPPLTFALERHDDLDPDGAISSTRRLVTVGLGDELVTMDLDDLGAYRHALLELERRGRREVIADQWPDGP